ncbi:uncharacterized protein [Rutidosis leptorrhynchoides]|uniref:uncharacterized protein n=1 Tax=Rutidosis leptorrhynchoides TaxID=125765 RepID=UPI003A99FF89
MTTGNKQVKEEQGDDSELTAKVEAIFKRQKAEFFKDVRKVFQESVDGQCYSVAGVGNTDGDTGGTGDASDADDRIIEVRGKWKANGCILNILNVYGPHEDCKKQTLWENLTGILSNSDEAWALCGDFNEFRGPSERLNCEFVACRAKRFDDFIVNNNLFDIPLGGRMFTRVSDDGLKFSKLDRFLVFENFVSLWVNLLAMVMERKDSDHCPIRLMDEEKKFGPKPWKILDCWFDTDEANHIVKNVWISDTDTAAALKSWSTNHFGQLDGEIKAHKNTVQALEIKAESAPLNHQELDLWKNSRKCWLEKEKIKADMLKQKARIRWTLEGDENLKFFHSIIRNRYNMSNIRGVLIDGVWNDSPEAIKAEAFKHFSQIFEETNNTRPSMEDLIYPSITSEEAAELENKFLESEILDAINDCGSTKAPGPDGFNMRFFKKF